VLESPIDPAITPEITARGLAGTIVATALRPPARPSNLFIPEIILARAFAPEQPSEVAPAPPDQGLNRATVINGDICNSRLAQAIPRRSRNAPTGSNFMAGLTSANGGARDRLITDQILAGNVPDFMRDLVPVVMTRQLSDGSSARITICVTPDYLALGSDSDFTRVPLGLPAASRIAYRFGMMLPTTRMVDEIFAQADLRLSPRPMNPGAQMSSTAYFVEHNATVNGQRRDAGVPLGALIAGQKKDLVLTNRLVSASGRVAIYGWHQPGGRPIQSLSTVHGASYADYSHGIRLVSRTAYVDRRPVDLGEMLSSSRYAGFLSNEGPIQNASLQLASR
jgi:hypothetical protein